MGVRPISNVVDSTNYVMLEIGQPLHAFDLDRVGGETIVVRTADDGETLVTLDGEERALSTSDLVIADSHRPMGLAGIMGGEDSEVSASTTRVLLEAAHFSPGGVLLSANRHGLRSEASARFERGVDPELPPLASARATALITELAGGSAVGELIDVEPAPRSQTRVAFDVGEVERLLGVPVPAAETASILGRLGFAVAGEGPLEVTVPSFRPDVTRPADLVEEVARLHGFDRIPSRLPKGIGGGLPAPERLRRRLREVLVGAGFFEVMNFDFVGLAEIAALGFDAEDPRAKPVRLRNPLSDEQEHLRTTLLPGLLSGLRANAARNRRDVALFEIGTVFHGSDGPIPEQPLMAGFAASGSIPGVSWQPSGARDALDGIGLVHTVFAAFGVPYDIVQGAEPGLHPGRSARIVVGEETVGAVGELHPAVAEMWGLEGRIVVGEFAPGALRERTTGPFLAPSSLPPVVFDLAFDVPEGTAAAQLLSAIEESAGEWLERMVVFDVFTGPPLDEGRTSIAVRLTFRHPARTLSDDDLVPVREAIASRVSEAVSGRLRGG
jgi:phenylalanyl-tRNA synthetase beta chain